MVKRRRERKTRSESKTLRRELGELAEAFGDKSPEERRELEALRREIEDLEREETAFDSPAERRKRGAWLRHWLGQAVAAGPVAAGVARRSEGDGQAGGVRGAVYLRLVHPAGRWGGAGAQGCSGNPTATPAGRISLRLLLLPTLPARSAIRSR